MTIQKISLEVLTLKSIDALLEKILPELEAQLKEAKNNLQSGDLDMSAVCAPMLSECTELLKLISGQNKQEEDRDSSDLLADLAATAGIDQPDIAANDSEDKIELDTESDDPDMAAMLSELEGKEENVSGMKTKASDNSTQEAVQSEPEDGEISDEEAMALLAAMDDSTPTETQTTDKSSGEMADDEAARLLAEMDAPSEPSNDSMADDEAARLLAEMDAPVAPPQGESSAEDDAAALLAQLEGGAAEQSEAPGPTPDPAAANSSASSSGVPIEEIPEWSENDFQTDPDMINDFNSNCDEIMESLDETVLKLEQDPTNKEVIEEIFRGAHTLKGAAGMFGFSALERVMHRMENLFDLVRKGKLVPDASVIDTVFQGLDCLRTLLAAVKDGKPCGIPTAEIVYALEQAAEGKTYKIAGASAVEEQPASNGANEPEPNTGGSQAKPASPATKKKEQSTIRVDLERLDVLVNLIGELVIDRTRFASIEEDLRTNYPQVQLGGSFSETVQLFGRHMNEIQDIIMKVRMVPIGNAFNKFSRIVRDLARNLDKKIDLVISGEGAELDKTLVEQIGDPLIHLIRNSCDHGVEDPATRQAAGKNPVGRIMLSAHQEGNHIVIKIEDDGKGIPLDVIRKKGIEKGLITEEQTLEPRDIYALIFEPGFSTAEKVTNISGRGVGMDVVKKNIMKLKGMIEIDSELGKGTTTTIRLPLTLAIVQSLLVRSNREVFAIPLSSVIESIRIAPSDIQKVGDTEVYKLRDKVLPLVHLEDVLDLAGKKDSYADLLGKNHFKPKGRVKQDRIFVVVVGHADRPTGIIVDQLMNQQEMVIKSMGGLMKDIPCVAGGAVLGHGEVVLVLDVPELEEATRLRRPAA